MSDENTTRDSFCVRVVEKGARGYIRDDEKTKKSKRCDKATTRGWTTRGREEEGMRARVDVRLEYVPESTFRRFGEEKS
jgi:hypothetical protein